MNGPGIYDEECTLVRKLLKADGVLLIVLTCGGEAGFSVQMSASLISTIPSLLRTMADDIEADNAAYVEAN